MVGLKINNSRESSNRKAKTNVTFSQICTGAGTLPSLVRTRFTWLWMNKFRAMNRCVTSVKALQSPSCLLSKFILSSETHEQIARMGVRSGLRGDSRFTIKLTSNSRRLIGWDDTSRDVSSSRFPGCYRATRQNRCPRVCTLNSQLENPSPSWSRPRECHAVETQLLWSHRSSFPFFLSGSSAYQEWSHLVSSLDVLHKRILGWRLSESNENKKVK